nr:immunoglobulin heavy chain junction region [Macaca mulatta]
CAKDPYWGDYHSTGASGYYGLDSW